MPRRTLALALDAFIALVFFGAGTALVGSLAPPAEGGRLPTKMEHFAEHKDEYDALYFGASRVFRGIDAGLVDEELARAGLEMRSFNFGAAGVGSFEQDFLLHHVLDQEPARLRWVFYGGRPVGTAFAAQHGFDEDLNLESARGVQWHTLEETRKVLGAIRRMPAGLLEKLELAATHLDLMGRNLCNLGRGRAILGRLLESDLERRARLGYLEYVADHQGYAGLEEITGRPLAEGLEGLLTDPSPYVQRIARIPAMNSYDVELDEIHLGVYRDQIEAVAERGAEMIYFTMPGLEGSPERLRLHERGILPTLFHFNDPYRFPKLYRIDHRHDMGHLNRRGVELFSKLFAEAVLEHVRATER